MAKHEHDDDAALSSHIVETLLELGRSRPQALIQALADKRIQPFIGDETAQIILEKTFQQMLEASIH